MIVPSTFSLSRNHVVVLIVTWITGYLRALVTSPVIIGFIVSVGASLILLVMSLLALLDNEIFGKGIGAALLVAIRAYEWLYAVLGSGTAVLFAVWGGLAFIHQLIEDLFLKRKGRGEQKFTPRPYGLPPFLYFTGWYFFVASLALLASRQIEMLWFIAIFYAIGVYCWCHLVVLHHFFQRGLAFLRRTHL